MMYHYIVKSDVSNAPTAVIFRASSSSRQHFSRGFSTFLSEIRITCWFCLAPEDHDIYQSSDTKGIHHDCAVFQPHQGLLLSTDIILFNNHAEK